VLVRSLSGARASGYLSQPIICSLFFESHVFFRSFNCVLFLFSSIVFVPTLRIGKRGAVCKKRVSEWATWKQYAIKNYGPFVLIQERTAEDKGNQQADSDKVGATGQHSA